MKREHKEMLRERAREAIRDLYHNATIIYPRELYGRSEEFASEWVAQSASDEIEYLAGGGAYGPDYAKTLRANCNAGRYKSERAQAFYVRAKMRAMREERSRYAMHEWITDYGRLYQWGRGGRTLAPADLVRTGGGSRFSMREDYADELPTEALTRLIRVLEAFNRYVGQWCAGVPEQWREYCAEEDAEILRQKRKAAARKAKETRERNFWAARDVPTC